MTVEQAIPAVKEFRRAEELLAFPTVPQANIVANRRADESNANSSGCAAQEVRAGADPRKAWPRNLALPEPKSLGSAAETRIGAKQGHYSTPGNPEAATGVTRAAGFQQLRLLTTHHSASKQQAETRGFYNDIGADGWPIDPRHPAYQV